MQKNKRECGLDKNKRPKGKISAFSFFPYIFVFILFSLQNNPQNNSQNDKPIRFEESRISMACTYSIIAYGREEHELKKILNEALDEIDRIDRLMSHYKKESELSKINREASNRPVRVDSELFDFISECIKYSRESDGAFDITVGPLMKAWGFFRDEGRLPSEAELSSARRSTGYQHIILNNNEKTVRFDITGVELDLGGIAKGYAVDRAVSLLKSRGIERALVNACGSTIYGLGSPPDSSGWEMKIQDPIDHKKIALTVSLNNQTLSVSGSYEKFFEVAGVKYSHIMDPRTGMPAQGVLSVAVLTDTGTAGDALDNVFFVLGIERTRKLIKRYPITEVIFFLPDSSQGWKLIRVFPQ
jgi:FAD:protein FMN transferase